jgi:HSP20 family protein
MNQLTQQNRLGRVLSAGLPEFDNLFNQFFRAEEVAMWRAPASIWEADNMFHIEIDAPGVMKDDVELTFDKGALQVTLERKAPEGERTNWHNERGYGKVSRSVSLPETVDPNTITAELINGVLHVTITKLPEAQPKKIDVKVSCAGVVGPASIRLPAGREVTKSCVSRSGWNAAPQRARVP